jgi:hypothetical protein
MVFVQILCKYKNKKGLHLCKPLLSLVTSTGFKPVTS